MKNRIILATIATASLGCAQDGVTRPIAEGPRLVRMAGNNQIGEVNTRLASDVSVRVLKFGAPASGVTIYWRSDETGAVDSTVSNTEGVASVRWILGTRAGSAWLTASGKPADSLGILVFRAIATSAAPATMTILYGNNLSAPANSCTAAITLGARVADAFGNAIVAPLARWRVIDGPLALRGDTSATGQVNTLFGTGAPGTGHVQAWIPNTDMSVTFTATMSPPRYFVTLRSDDYYYSDDVRMISGQTCSETDLVDYMPVGATMYWINSDPDMRRIALAGPDALADTLVVAPRDSTGTVFTKPGTYSYKAADSNTGVIGTIIVR